MSTHRPYPAYWEPWPLRAWRQSRETGASAGDAYARRGVRLLAGERCGDHDVSRYLAEVNALTRRFRELALLDRWNG